MIKLRHRLRWIGLLSLLGGVIAWVGSGWLSQIVVEYLWFQEVGFLPILAYRWGMKLAIASIVILMSLSVLLSNLHWAKRLRYPQPPADLPHSGPDWFRQPIAYPTPVPAPSPKYRFSLWQLLSLAVGLSLGMAFLLWHYGQEAVQLWQMQTHPLTQTPPLPQPLWPPNVQHLIATVRQLSEPSGYLSLMALTLAIVGVWIQPVASLRAIAIGFSLMLGYVVAGSWNAILLALRPVEFGQVEPQFGWDISFYVFQLPLWELLAFWWVGLVGLTLVAVMLIYLLSGNSLSQGQFLGFSQAQKRHLRLLSGGMLLVVAGSYWLSRYALLYSDRDVLYGANYTDVHVQLPINTALAGLALVLAGDLFWRAYRTPPHRVRFLSVLLVYGAVALVGTTLIPWTVQQVLVQPNELARERPYIDRAIRLTRQAFGLDQIDTQPFTPSSQLTYRDILRNELTIRNIRLWDTRPLLETNRQLQQIRPYYKFFDADLDRYLFGQPGQRREKQQVLIAARELDYASVPADAQTWVNEHLVYTHGYGFTVSPVNQVVLGGLPDYFVQDIGTSNPGRLTTSTGEIRTNIPTQNPRIYYGEGTNTYVMTGTRVAELDYPQGEENVYNVYDGQGGIALNAPWRRWVFARYLLDWQMLFTQDFTPETKLLFRRNIQQRIRTIAPFLRFDSDPYLVAADVGEPGTPASTVLYWIADAYTTSDRYPYSEPEQITDRQFNYIRNSVKVVVDAYHGSVKFYVADPQDPIVRAWMSIFPQVFQPLSAMPAALREHIRYPVDLFNIQAERLINYHVTDPQVFYNREDMWQVPNEIYGSQTQPVEPYFLITSLPSEPLEEFILLLPYTPNQRRNLTAWFAARSDGADYGKSLLYQFPKQRLVYGPEQIEARINQDPVISQQISLWNREGSRVRQGNLLVIPIESSLLYIEPIYLEAEQNSLPTLVRVVAAYENTIVMANTLEQALQAVFQPAPVEPTIVRPVE